MEESHYCEECLKEQIYINGQKHHIAHRSTSPCMKHVPINFKYLCQYHHTGPTGPHLNPKKDIEYKQELQLKLQLLFNKEFYDFKEIKELLDCSDNSVKAIIKTLVKTKEGYRKMDLIRKMLGDRLYL